MNARQLTSAEKALIERVARELPRAALHVSRPHVVVADEVDEQGRIQWTTSVALGEVLPRA